LLHETDADTDARLSQLKIRAFKANSNALQQQRIRVLTASRRAATAVDVVLTGRTESP
jgi:hypothetical protein